jgi:hypothetical protein
VKDARAELARKGWLDASYTGANPREQLDIAYARIEFYASCYLMDLLVAPDHAKLETYPDPIDRPWLKE